MQHLFPRYITGIDKNLLSELAESHEVVVTLESGSLNGGFGEKIASFYGTYRNMRVLNRGLSKAFLDTVHTRVEEVLYANRLTSGQLIEDIVGLLKK